MRYIDDPDLPVAIGLGGRLAHDKGFVTAMTGLLIIPLMVFVAFAVDLGAWYAQGTKEQRAADGAALAGAAYMPDLVTGTNVALEVARRNGYPNGVGGVVVTVTQPTGFPNRIRVSITSPAPIYFAKVGGINSQNVRREATGEFNLNLDMGSPLNFLGRDPDVDPLGIAGRVNDQQAMWLNVAAYAGDESNGDQVTASNCNGSTISTFNPCSGASGAGTNSTYDANGYFFLVKNAGTGGPGALNIQAYDPAGFDVQDRCDNDRLVALGTGPADTTSNIHQLRQQYAGGSLGIVGATNYLSADATNTVPGAASTNYGDPIHRWGNFDAVGVAPTPPPGYSAADAGRGEDYCNGDWVNAGTARTTWIVRAPDLTPLNHLDNPPICAITFQGQQAINAYNILSSTTNANWATGADRVEATPFYKHFRNWFTLCQIDTPVAGDYVVQVKQAPNTTSMGSSPRTVAAGTLDIGTLGNSVTTLTAAMHNRYSLRAGWMNAEPTSCRRAVNICRPGAGWLNGAGNATWSNGVSVTAARHLTVYANTSGAGPGFYLARITPNYKGDRIRLSLWDIGDGATATITIIPPADATPNPPIANPPGCIWDRDGGALPGGTAPSGPTNCQAGAFTTTNFNGRMTNVVVQLSPSYSCNDTDPRGCWFRINVTSTTQANDTTTWRATVIGNPVHLVS